MINMENSVKVDAYVTDIESLCAALTVANVGDVIYLAAGEYGDFLVQKRDRSSE